MESLKLKKPIIYSNNKNVINCTEYLAASYVSFFGLPFHWLLSNNWNFSYRNVEDFSSEMKDDLTPFKKKLFDLFGVETKRHSDRELNGLFSEMKSKGSLLVIRGESWYLPWHVSYEKDYIYHIFAITDFQDDKFYSISWVPHLEQDGWVDSNIIKNSFNAFGKKSYELTKPNNEFVPDYSTVIKSLNSCHHRIIKGISELMRFKEDIVKMQSGSDSLYTLWWDLLKDICTDKEGFCEFLYYIDHEMCKLPSTLLLSFHKTALQWSVLRNSIMKAKIMGIYKLDHIVSVIDKIIINERNCAINIRDFLANPT